MHSAMEQTRYWMWTRRKLSGMSLLDPTHVLPVGSFYESWEEKAFAEDSAAHLGGCVWPPRSYSCSFCRREFRSAQALGGHMNVHRRDRARLKQPSSPTSENIDDLHATNSSTSAIPLALEAQFPAQVCTSVYNPTSGALGPPLPASRVSTTSTQGNSVRNTLNSAPFSSCVIQDSRTNYLFSIPQSLKTSIDIPAVNILELKLGRETLKRKDDCCHGGKDEHVDGDGDDDADDDDNAVNRKRRRLDPVLPLFVRSAFDKPLLKPKVLELGDEKYGELDLELRLGDPPKVSEQSNGIELE